MNKNFKIIIIEGNIGSGKSSLLELLRKRHKNIKTFEEDVCAWEPYFKLALKNKKHYYLLQKKILTHYLNIKTEIELLSRTENFNLFILERSAYSALHVFTKIALLNNVITQNEYGELNNLFELSKLKDTIILFINTSPTVCYERIKNRGRNFEQNINLHYLQQIHNMYDTCIFQYIIKGTGDTEQIYKKFIDIVKKL